jgi:class 3 adenylate cyclase
MWEHPASADFLSRLAAFTRLILFDRRGRGASDPMPPSAVGLWEGWAEDLEAVLDAAGSQRAFVFGEVDSGPISILFAAMHPDRVQGLILANSSARYSRADDYRVGVPADEAAALLEMMSLTWGTEELAAMAHPAWADDRNSLRWSARVMRVSDTPRAAAEQVRDIIAMDVRHALPLIQAPTLILHNTGNRFMPLEQGRFLAQHIADARLREFANDEAYLYSAPEVAEIRAAIAEFITGEAPPIEIDRILTTILFTDIVASTERAAALGDRRWKQLLDAHDRVVRDQLHHYRGLEVNTTGDGFHASFDGPARAIHCARAIQGAVGELGLRVRAGLHTGECELRGDDLAGLAVHIAARVGARAAPGEILVSSTVRDLVVGSGIAFEDRGESALKGVPGTWRLFAATG